MKKSKRKSYKAYWIMTKSKLTNLDKVGKLYQTMIPINQLCRQKINLEKYSEQYLQHDFWKLIYILTQMNIGKLETKFYQYESNNKSKQSHFDNFKKGCFRTTSILALYSAFFFKHFSIKSFASSPIST